MKWKPKLILNGLKILSMKFEHMIFIDGASYLPVHYASYQKHLGSP